MAILIYVDGGFNIFKCYTDLPLLSSDIKKIYLDVGRKFLWKMIRLPIRSSASAENITLEKGNYFFYTHETNLPDNGTSKISFLLKIPRMKTMYQVIALSVVTCK